MTLTQNYIKNIYIITHVSDTYTKLHKWTYTRVVFQHLNMYKFRSYWQFSPTTQINIIMRCIFQVVRGSQVTYTMFIFILLKTKWQKYYIFYHYFGVFSIFFKQTATYELFSRSFNSFWASISRLCSHHFGEFSRR